MRKLVFNRGLVFILVVIISICFVSINMFPASVNADNQAITNQYVNEFGLFQAMLPGTKFLSGGAISKSSGAGSGSSYTQKYSKDRILVKFKKGVSGDAASSTIKKHGMKLKKSFKKTKIKVLDRPKDKSVEEAINELIKDPSVEYAEPDHIMTINLIPNDTMFNELWGLHNTGQAGGTYDVDIDAPEAWEINTGSAGPDGEVVVAVIDTGVDYTHEDLINMMWVNEAEAAGTLGIDDDGNGYMDDIYGIDTFNNDVDPKDDHGHGTHVSGTIAAEGNNNKGITGVCWDGGVKIMALKFIGRNGFGYTSDAVECLEYIVTMVDSGVNVRVSSNSWGGGLYNNALYDAIKSLRDRDVLFVAAAGSSGEDTDSVPHYPSSYDLDNIISVTATTRDDELGWSIGLFGFFQWANRGVYTVDVAAPGKEILSSVPNNGTYQGNYSPAPGDIFFDDAESGIGNWTADPPWEITGMQQAYSGSASWTDSPGVDYENNVNVSLTSEIIDLSVYSAEELLLGFRALMDIEPGWDFLYVEVSGDGGTVWHELGDLTGKAMDWGLYNFTVPNNVKTSEFRFRLRFVSDSSVVRDGIYIDDIGIGIVDTSSLPFFDNMESGADNWAAGGTWALTTENPSTGSYSWSDSPYDNCTAGSLTSVNIDISSATDPFLTLSVDVWLSLSENEHLYIYISADGGITWKQLSHLTGIITDWRNYEYNIPDSYRTDKFRVRFTVIDGPGVTDDGVYIDNVKIYPMSYSTSYKYFNGTSMATPHVAGLAALLQAYHGNLAYDTVRDIMYSSVEPVPELTGKTLTGGRINANNALLKDPLNLSPIILDITPKTLPVNGTLTITGSNFGDTQGTVSLFPDKEGSLVSWSNNKIEVTVPYGSKTGNVSITTFDSRNSNQLPVYIGKLLRQHPPMIKKVYRPVAVETGAKLYVISGLTSEGTYPYDVTFPTNIVQIYDPYLNYWSQGANKPTPVVSAASATVGGKIYVFGGYYDASLHPYYGLQDNLMLFGGSFSNVLEIYDPATDTWETSATTLPKPLVGLTAVALDGMIYVIGGLYDSPIGAKVCSSELYRYDPQTDTYTQLSSMKDCRIKFAAGVIDGKICVFGGSGGSIGNMRFLSEGEVYDPATDTWSEISPMNVPRYEFSGAAMGGKLYAIGGKWFSGRMIKPFRRDIEVYDPDTDTWETDINILSVAKVGTAALSFNDSYIYLFGGYDGIEVSDGMESFSFVPEGTYDPITINTLSADPEDGPLPKDAHFSVSAAGGSGNYAYLWDFGDGSVGSSEQNPAHTYTGYGSYIASVTISDLADISNSITGQVSVTIIDPEIIYSAVNISSLNATPSVGTIPLDVDFNVTATGGSKSYIYSWNFGDGSAKSSEQNPVHIYSEEGEYTVELTVTDSENPLNFTTGQLTVTAMPVPGDLNVLLDAAPARGYAPLEVTFTIEMYGSAERPFTVECFYDGKGNKEKVITDGRIVTLTHTYEDAGSYMVGITVTAADGAHYSTFKPLKASTIITIEPPESASGGGGGGCFVATVSYEDNSRPSVIDGAVNRLMQLFK
jgi:PKD repeat protein